MLRFGGQEKVGDELEPASEAGQFIAKPEQRNCEHAI